MHVCGCVCVLCNVANLYVDEVVRSLSDQISKDLQRVRAQKESTYATLTQLVSDAEASNERLMRERDERERTWKEERAELTSECERLRECVRVSEAVSEEEKKQRATLMSECERIRHTSTERAIDSERMKEERERETKREREMYEEKVNSLNALTRTLERKRAERKGVLIMCVCVWVCMCVCWEREWEALCVCECVRVCTCAR